MSPSTDMLRHTSGRANFRLTDDDSDPDAQPWTPGYRPLFDLDRLHPVACFEWMRTLAARPESGDPLIDHAVRTLHADAEREFLAQFMGLIAVEKQRRAAVAATRGGGA